MGQIRFGNGDVFSTARGGGIVKKASGLTPVSLQTSVTCPHTGVVFSFVAPDGVTPEARYVGQHILGDWFVIATPANPVRIGSMTPAYQTGTGTIRRWRGVNTAGALHINGAMLNPRHLASGTGNENGFCSYKYDNALFVPYLHSKNVDPAATGTPLVLTGDGDVLVKAKCWWMSNPPTDAETGGAVNIGTITMNYACLTVRHSVPKANSFRPATGPAAKADTINLGWDDVVQSIFNLRLPQSDIVGGLTMKALAQARDQISSYSFSNNNDRSRNVRAADNHGSGYAVPVDYKPNDRLYDRDEISNFCQALCLTLQAPTEGTDNALAWKNRLISCLAQYAIGIMGAIRDGDDMNQGAGYGMGRKVVVAAGARMFGSPAWMRALCDRPRPYPGTGTVYHYPERPEFGAIDFGVSEDNRFFELTSLFVGYSTVFRGSTATRRWPSHFQAQDIGVPFWSAMDDRFDTLSGAARKLNASPDADRSYCNMQLAIMQGMVALHMMRGGAGVFANPVPLQALDRLRQLTAQGLTKTGEGGYFGYNRSFVSRFRAMASVPIWAGRPERPAPPRVDGFVGEPTALMIYPASNLVTFGYPILQQNLRWTTTQPSASDFAQAIWTTINNVSFAPGYPLTGVPQGADIYVQHQIVTAQGASPWSFNHRNTVRYPVDASGNKISGAAALGPYDEPGGKQAVGRTSAGAAPVMTRAPRILGAPTIGGELFFDKGEWSVEPWMWTIVWKVGSTVVASGVDRWTPAGPLGSQATVEWVAANTVSGTSGTTPALTLREAEVRAAPLITAAAQVSAGSSTSSRTRLLAGVAAGAHPTRVLSVLAYATLGTSSLDPDTSTNRIMNLQTDAGVNVDGGVQNEIVAARSQHYLGGRPTVVRFHDVQSVAAGGKRLSFYTLNRTVITSMAAFNLAGYDLASSWSMQMHEQLEIDADDPEGPYEASVTLLDAAGRQRTVPKGSLIIAAAAFDRSHDITATPIWTDNVQPIAAATGTGVLDAANDWRNMVAMAMGLHAATGPITVGLSMDQIASCIAFSVLIVPPI